MKKIGIVAEYNPFHNGHLYQINEIRKRFEKEAIIIVVVSGNYVQRGEISFLNKFEKTKIALEMGVDLVVELPVFYSIQNAEIFCKMSTKILDYLDVDIQVFGAEEDNLKKFYDVIDLQEKMEYKQGLMEIMKKGNSYTTSQKLSLEQFGYVEIVKSNNILGLEYIRTILKEKLKIKPYIVKREISEYNELEIEKDRENIASATFLRNIFENFDNNIEKNSEIEKIKKFVPNETFEILKDKKSKKYLKNEIFKFFKYKILMEKEKEIKKIYDVTDEIYARMYKEVKVSKNFSEFINNCKSRNFSIKRIERIMLNIVLNINKESVNFNVDYVRVLGFNEKGQKYLKYLKKLEKKVFVNWRDIEKSIEKSKKKLNIENNIKNFENKLNIQEDVKNFKNKVKIEKNAFLLRELLENETENLNPIIVKG